MNGLEKLTQAYSRRRFAWLFCSLGFTLTAAPIIAALGLSTQFMEVFLVFNLLATVVGSFVGIGWLRVGGGLLILALGIRGGYALVGYEPLLSTSQGVGASVFLLSAFALFRHLLSGGRVDSERIFAALSAYLMIGILCGLLFCIFEEVWPGSLSFNGQTVQWETGKLLAGTIYFSFVTLGTLGYGDIIPMSGPAKAVAVMEAIVGQMYLAVVVARLVSMFREGDDSRCPPSGG